MRDACGSVTLVIMRRTSDEQAPLEPGPSPCADAARARLQSRDAELSEAARRAEFEAFNQRLRELVAAGVLR